MVPAIAFGLAMFVGWVIYDLVKHKALKKENLASAFVAGVVGGVFWFVFDLIF